MGSPRDIESLPRPLGRDISTETSDVYETSRQHAEIDFNLSEKCPLRSFAFDIQQTGEIRCDRVRFQVSLIVLEGALSFTVEGSHVANTGHE